MSAEALLSRLEKVRQTGPDRWLACCPAHDDRHPSLGIRELDDGRVLIICRSNNCSAADIVAAVGLDLADLFPPQAAEPDYRHSPFMTREKRPFPAADVLTAMYADLLLFHQITRRAADFGALDDSDKEAVHAIGGRFARALQELKP